MDLLYLLRSGLGIPDYWHPYLELQTDFLSGQVGRYPMSMDVKAEYPGALNDEGVPVVFWGPERTPSPSPVNIILYGLGNHDVFLRTRDEASRRHVLSVLRWLDRHAIKLGDGIGWANQESLPLFSLTAPWFSGIIQGFALSLFVRGHSVDPQGPWAKRAQQTWLSFRVPVESGGFRRAVEGGAIYEEYPGPELDCVFNGVCHALIGLWEAWRSDLVAEAEADFRAGLHGLRGYLPQFDYNGWSLYSLNRCLGKPYLASPYYFRANAVLAQIVGLMGGERDFCAYGERWLKSSNSVIRRILMSARIGLERYRHAPLSLQFDKSKGR